MPQAELIDNESHTVSSESLLYAGALVAVIMAAGNALGRWFTDQFGYALPAYVGAMLIAIIVRNVIDTTRVVPLRMEDMDVIGNLTLSFFLTQAMMTLKIWELANVAGPLMGILVVQVTVLLAFAVFVVFPLMGRDYDAATMVGGLMGHGLGATPNGIANMDAISKAHRARSTLAFVVVPLAGSVLIDIVSVPWITFCLNFFA
ncbi:sodium/glutamate symport carrier protein [Mobilicoccus pelagius NBRC 104925]|uniref:Sodium/glutamate symport carrier protein n=1 Tax=Mobilicoccus pelagius NBRC 104925 TaxID=1089455 RepID=H5UPV5_9MICO|nr:sodium/glutamate symport carrier protein [Mobilicoccus pelagius NBRC 104925]